MGEVINFEKRRDPIGYGLSQSLGSTHPDEEADLLAAIHAVRTDGRDVQWLWAPRHPRDAGALVEHLAEQVGLAELASARAS